MATRLGTPKAVQPVAPVPSSRRRATSKGDVPRRRPTRYRTVAAWSGCSSTRTTTAGLTFRPATAKEAMAFLLGTVHTVAEYDALMDTMAEQGQRRVDAIKGAVAPKAPAPPRQSPRLRRRMSP